jgi:hypothetical protein
VVFFTTGLHGDYHQVTDEPQYIDYPHMARVGQLVFDIATQVGNLDHRIVVDKEKPDRLASAVSGRRATVPVSARVKRAPAAHQKRVSSLTSLSAQPSLV